MNRWVADVGNSRVKCAPLRPDGTLGEVTALACDAADSWAATLASRAEFQPGTSWTIASVNPVVTERLGEVLRGLSAVPVRVLGSASDVPVPHLLTQPARTGADRAFAVREAVLTRPPDEHRPGQVISCGSAITVERIGATGIWEGGAIAPGLGLAARALNRMTAQLPLVDPGSEPPAAWGVSTEPAIAAGLFWGAVGAIREILRRQAEEWDTPPWRIWTGGDAALLAPWIDGPGADVRPHLVLEALARLVREEAGTT